VLLPTLKDSIDFGQFLGQGLQCNLNIGVKIHKVVEKTSKDV